ncbi:PAP-specific phosphatase HAL2-like [Solanum pennellii]|uniref:3'(2'),5'-bisphosphate nucleotidase n=1 Tax=Solanum pennellii TaxID=28526 RepID=A0ABM1G809_SOLPN|nr:PAP-specific phosphatase HAL2-like [Solanum pennellii]
MSSCTTSFSTKVSPTFRKNDIFLKKQMLGTISFSSKKDSYLGFTAQTSSHTDFVSAMDEDCKLELKSNYISDGYCKELEIAVRAVHMACLLCQRVQENLLSENSEHVHSKEDDSPVTIADWSVQAIVSWVLSEAYGSNVSIVAEEDVEALSKASAAGLLEAVVRTVNECLSDAPRFGLKGPGTDLDAKAVLEAISRCSLAGARGSKFWVLDPVDGTLGFVRGDQYAIALALIEDGEPVLGVLGCPNYPMKKEWLSYQNGYRRILSRLSSSTSESSDRGSVLYARKGGGRAWMQPLLRGENKFVWPNAAREIRVSSIDNPALATFCEPVEKANSSHSFTAGLAHSVGLRNQPLRVYSMVKYAAIARGDAEIYMKFARAGYKEKIWDHAAGVLIIEEAGGVVTDAGGQPLDFSKGEFLEGLDRGIIACAGAKLHETIIGAVDASWNSSSL